MAWNRRHYDVHVDVHVAPSAEVTGAMNRLERKLDRLLGMGAEMATDLSQIQAGVKENGDATQSAIQLINNLADAVENAGTDQAALNELSSQLRGQAQALADAVVANTPAESGGTGNGGATGGDGGTPPSEGGEQPA